MRITVFGASGSVGRHVVEQALRNGHDVTAFTRDRARITASDPRLEIVEGDATDPEALLPAVKGVDAVIVALGDGRKGGIREAGTAAVIDAMESAGVRRLICQSTIGVGDSRGNLTFWWKYVVFGALLRPAYQDHVRQEELVRASALDWTIVRPSAFTDGPVTGGYRHGFDGQDRTTQLKIARADVAHFLIGQLDDDSHVGRAVSLSY